MYLFVFFNDTSTTEIYTYGHTLSLHDARPILLPDAVYAPARSAAEGFLSTLGVTSTFYDPLAGARISELFQPTTRLVWVESPASFTMEVQDLPAKIGRAHV